MSNEGNPLCPRKQAVMSTGGKLLCPTGCERVSRQPSMSYRFRTFSTKKCVPSESRQPLEIKGSGGFQNGLMFQPHPESTSFTSMGSLVRVQLSPPLASPCRSRASTFFALRHHRRGVYFFQGSPWRREQLGPPFRSHGRLAQLPENRGGFVGGIRKKGLTEALLR